MQVVLAFYLASGCTQGVPAFDDVIATDNTDDDPTNGNGGVDGGGGLGNGPTILRRAQELSAFNLAACPELVEGRNGGLLYLHADHLGSTRLTTSGSTPVGNRTYAAYGRTRDGTLLPTDYTFTAPRGLPQADAGALVS